MVINFFKEQAELLFSVDSFEVDMSFKRLRGKDRNEIVFAIYLPSHAKSRLI